MTSTPHLCGLILAAGASSRMGRDKALLPWPSNTPEAGTLLSATILALKPLTQQVIIVASTNAENLKPIAESLDARIAINPAPERGQFSSIQIGLQAVLDCGLNAAMLTPVDCPPLAAISLQLLHGRFILAIANAKWAVAPEHNGRRGHPLLLSRELIDAFLAAPVSSNAREVKHAHAERFEYVSVSDPFLSADMNTPEQFAAISALASAQST